MRRPRQAAGAAEDKHDVAPKSAAYVAHIKDKSNDLAQELENDPPREI